MSAWVSSSGEPDAPWGGLDRVAQMETKVPQIDAARLQIQAHLRSGQRAEALQVSNTEIYHQLELVEEATIRERSKVAEALASFARLSERAVDLAIGLIVVVTVLGVAHIVIMNRAILRPVSTPYSGAKRWAAGT